MQIEKAQAIIRRYQARGKVQSHSVVLDMLAAFYLPLLYPPSFLTPSTSVYFSITLYIFLPHLQVLPRHVLPRTPLADPEAQQQEHKDAQKLNGKQ